MRRMIGMQAIKVGMQRNQGENDGNQGENDGNEGNWWECRELGCERWE